MDDEEGDFFDDDPMDDKPKKKFFEKFGRKKEDDLADADTSFDEEPVHTATPVSYTHLNDGLKVGEDVKDASVTASVVENGKAKKVIVYKYKRKTGYHKKNGHRQQYTKVKIEKINA